MLNSLWNATTSHRVAAAIAGGAILLGSGMAAEASGLAPSVRDAVQNAVQGDEDEDENEGLELQSHELNGEEDNHGNVFEVAETEVDGNLIKHIGGNHNLLMRTILLELHEDGISVAGPADEEYLYWASENDPKIQLPGARAGGEDPTFEDLRDALQALLDEDGDVLVIVEGTCEDAGEGNYECEVERLTVLGNSKAEHEGGPPEGVGGGQPEGVGQANNENLGGGKPENPGKPEGVGKPDSTPPDDED